MSDHHLGASFEPRLGSRDCDWLRASIRLTVRECLHSPEHQISGRDRALASQLFSTSERAGVTRPDLNEAMQQALRLKSQYTGTPASVTSPWYPSVPQGTRPTASGIRPRFLPFWQGASWTRYPSLRERTYKSEITGLPGDRTLRVAEYILDRGLFLMLEQLVYDMQEEFFEALNDGRERLAQAVVWRWRLRLVWGVTLWSADNLRRLLFGPPR